MKENLVLNEVGLIMSITDTRYFERSLYTQWERRKDKNNLFE